MHMCMPMCNLHVGYNTKSALMGLNRFDCLDSIPNKL